jgi:hypothetical protein
MKRFFIITFLLFVTVNVAKAGFNGISVGLGGGYTNYKNITAEGFCQANLTIRSLPFQPKIGLSYHAFTTDLGTFKDLEVAGLGLFLEATIFPLRKYLFTGVRLEFHTNWYTNDNQIEQLKNTYADPPYSIVGINPSAIVGVDIPIVNRLNFRLYVMPGVRFYTISNAKWQVSSDGVDVDVSKRDKISKSYTTFTNQINAALVVNVFHRKK